MHIYYYKVFPSTSFDKEYYEAFFANDDEFEEAKKGMDKQGTCYKVLLDLWIDEDDYNTEDLKEDIIHELEYKDEIDDIFTICRLVKNYKNSK